MDTIREKVALSRANARLALDRYHARPGADEYLVDLGDLIGDLLHLADELDPENGGEATLRLAVGHYRDERDADPDADPAAIATSALDAEHGIGRLIEALEAERAHYARRQERETALSDGLRRDGREGADYAEGVRVGLDLALSRLYRTVTP